VTSSALGSAGGRGFLHSLSPPSSRQLFHRDAHLTTTPTSLCSGSASPSKRSLASSGVLSNSLRTHARLPLNSTCLRTRLPRARVELAPLCDLCVTYNEKAREGRLGLESCCATVSAWRIGRNEIGGPEPRQLEPTPAVAQAGRHPQGRASADWLARARSTQSRPTSSSGSSASSRPVCRQTRSSRR